MTPTSTPDPLVRPTVSASPSSSPIPRGDRLRGKVAVVTGGSRGIGAAIAERFAAEGASVVVNFARNPTSAAQVVASIEARGGVAVAVRADVTDRKQVTALFDAAVARFGRVDVVVNNAGVGEFRPLEEIDDDHFDRQFDVNVRALLAVTQEGVRRFGDAGGRVVNVSSVAGSGALIASAVYGATKAAVDAITRILAAELGPRGITVNAIAPGPVETDMYFEVGVNHQAEALISQTPLRRIGVASDVASAALFFASDDSAWVTGEVVHVSGGLRS